MGSNSENSRQVISLSLIQLKHTQTKMLRFAVLFVAAVCSAIPIEDTPEVAEARAAHLALVEEAKAGLHAAKAPVNNDVQADQIATTYLADDEAVAAAKAEFLAAFADVEAGGLAAKQAPAPVHEVPEVVAPAVVKAVAAPIATVAGLPYAAYPYAAYPYAAHGFAYNTIAHHSYPYYAGLPYYGYTAGLPYHGYPFVAVQPAEEAAEEA